MNFSDKVKSMTASEIILAMVNGLKNPAVEVEMSTFGSVRTKNIFLGLISKKVCFGCAATNTICKIAGIKFKPSNVEDVYDRAKALNNKGNFDDKSKSKEWLEKEAAFLGAFEAAIDSLRVGEIYTYNCYAERQEFAVIKEVDFGLPGLSNNYTEEQLKVYEYLASKQ